MRLGLRPRLIIAFVLISVISAFVTAVSGYIEARNTILREAQDSTVSAFTDAIEALADEGRLRKVRADSVDQPIEDAVLNGISDALAASTGLHITVVSGQNRSDFGPDLAAFSPELLQDIHTGDRVLWQRVAWKDSMVLTMGAPLIIPDGDGRTDQQRIEFYAVHDLSAEEQSIDQITRSQWTALGSVALATMLALVAARSVLRPVRELTATAKRWRSGDLASRIEVRGDDEFTELANTFNHTADAIQQHIDGLRRMEADSRRFVADVSHELRTPLAAMTAVANVLDEEASQLSGDAAAAARLISSETHNLNRLVADLIEVSRFDSGTASLVMDRVNLTEVTMASLRSRGWIDRVQVEAPENLFAEIDPRRIDVVIANLVGNALRHGEPPVVVRLSADDSDLTLTVSDVGPGLAPEVASRVFQRFYKADTARSRSTGSGLGLSIAWENARLHGGRLEAANDPGRGAVFTLLLPRKGGR